MGRTEVASERVVGAVGGEGGRGGGGKGIG